MVKNRCNERFIWKNIVGIYCSYSEGWISCGNVQLIFIYIVFDDLESVKYGIDIEKGDF